MSRELTKKEQLVVEQFDKLRPGFGERAKKNILNNQYTGWADIIEEMSEEEITLGNLKEVKTYG